MIGANGLFVAAEFAFVAVDRSRVARLASEGRQGARVLEAILKHLSFHLSAAQLGITATSLVLGFLTEQMAHGLVVGLALAVVTVTQMVVSELVPKNLAIARPEPVALFLARPARLYGRLLGPLIRFFNNAANWTVRRFGIEPAEELTSVRSLEELELLIRSSGEEGTIDREAFTLLTRTIRFGGKTAADALVPRVEVVSVAPETSLTHLLAASVESGRSRFPVCRDGDLDHVVGIVHVKDVAGVPVTERSTATVATVMVDPFVVPETRDLVSLLAELRQVGSHLAIVVDEYGGTAGIITLEDVLEEIVGEIADEYDTPSNLTEIAPAGTYVLPGSFHPDEVAEASGFEMPEGDYETLAGFVLDRLAHIPEVGEGFTYDGWRLEVTERDRLRVATVKLMAPIVQGASS